MKKVLILPILLLLIFSCKKNGFSPEGPTDVRVKNLSDLSFVEVIVNTSEGIDTVGNIAAGGYSEYFRFDMAYPKAEISVKINGQVFSTGPVNYLGLTYIGQAKITYEVFISDMTNKKLSIGNCSLDAPLD
jgi:hypothetical protein